MTEPTRKRNFTGCRTIRTRFERRKWWTPKKAEDKQLGSHGCIFVICGFSVVGVVGAADADTSKQVSKFSSPMAYIKPNHTIYINNLNEKTKKEELRKALYTIFSEFGQVIDVLAFKTLKMRGQAHVIFKEMSSASNALRAMQGFPFYDKPMRIQFAREDSDVIAKAKGTYVDRQKKYQLAKQAEKRKKRGYPKDSKNGATPGHVENTVSDNAATVTVEKTNPPNKILFCTNLPNETTKQMLSILFSPYPGLKDIRRVPDRPDIAFVEFESEGEAIVARTALNDFKITPSQAIRVDYANK
uniref:RRM domain-containing protein n=2 Tax=Ascaris TaxID=6251 RepID=A0A9J2P534_ASCLU